jgi:hypothetical protein
LGLFTAIFAANSAGRYAPAGYVYIGYTYCGTIRNRLDARHGALSKDNTPGCRQRTPDCMVCAGVSTTAVPWMCCQIVRSIVDERLRLHSMLRVVARVCGDPIPMLNCGLRQVLCDLLRQVKRSHHDSNPMTEPPATLSNKHGNVWVSVRHLCHCLNRGATTRSTRPCGSTVQTQCIRHHHRKPPSAASRPRAARATETASSDEHLCGSQLVSIADTIGDHGWESRDGSCSAGWCNVQRATTSTITQLLSVQAAEILIVARTNLGVCSGDRYDTDRRAPRPSALARPASCTAGRPAQAVVGGAVRARFRVLVDCAQE